MAIPYADHLRLARIGVADPDRSRHAGRCGKEHQRDKVIGRLERPPILMGHSAGGVFTQLMLDRGYGAVGVAINSAPTEGVHVVLLSQLKSTFPVPRTVGFTPEQWRYAFTKTFTTASNAFRLRRLGPGARLLCLQAGTGTAAACVFVKGTRSLGHRVVWSYGHRSPHGTGTRDPRRILAALVHVLVVLSPSVLVPWQWDGDPAVRLGDESLCLGHRLGDARSPKSRIAGCVGHAP